VRNAEINVGGSAFFSALWCSKMMRHEGRYTKWLQSTLVFAQIYSLYTVPHSTCHFSVKSLCNAPVVMRRLR